MNILAAILAILLANILFFEYIDEVMAVKYCQYRLWKKEKNIILNSFFEKELRVIRNSLFKEEHRKKIKWLAHRWWILPADEKIAFRISCQQYFGG